MRCYLDDGEFRHEAGTHKGVLAVRTEHGHARTIGHFDTAYLLHLGGIDHRHVILAAHCYPKLTSIRSEEWFVRRSTDVHDAFNFICRCIDQSYRIGSDRHYSERLGIGRVSESMHKKLPLVERTQRSGHRIAESDYTEQFVLRRVDHSNRVRSLIGSVNAVVT